MLAPRILNQIIQVQLHAGSADLALTFAGRGLQDVYLPMEMSTCVESAEDGSEALGFKEAPEGHILKSYMIQCMLQKAGESRALCGTGSGS